ncbi:MAG: ABC transporter ATP-binding protein [Acidimicrobiales bacterium]|nr:ABC transporter ATP-binding protein [Acidimicrobiales bacterium]
MTAGSASLRPALELVEVVKEYAGNPPVRALDDVSLRVSRGELVAIVGPSGSGKSTMLNVMGTLDLPTSGSVLIDGREVSKFSDRRLSAVRSHSIGFVFQSFFLLDGVSALDNVANGLLYSGVREHVRRARAAAALETVGLQHRLGHVPSQLSGGERQRVAIARAIVNEPSIILADEPTGNLDTASSETVMSLLRELNTSGSTIVVITHDREVAASLPRQVAFRDGRIESDSALAEAR